MESSDPIPKNDLPWDGFCLDDGSGRNVYFIDKSGKRVRAAPDNFVPEYFQNGSRRYYYKGTCIRCKDIFKPIFLVAYKGEFAFSLNYCQKCILTTTITIQTIKGNGTKIWEAHTDTPLNSYYKIKDYVLDPFRDVKILARSKEANFIVKTLSKLRRNVERTRKLRIQAAQMGIGEGKYLSWGFGEDFEEYYGTVDANNQPHGRGMKIYIDKSSYTGGWLNGQRHSETTSFWIRPDGYSYEGTWMNDLKHGKGLLRYPDESVYKGEFAKGYEHGHGVKTFPDGSIFEGRFRFGKRDGIGILTNPDGTVEKRKFKENDVYYEKILPVAVEVVEEDENTKFFEPETLLTLGIRAVAKTMQTKRSLLPPSLLHRRLPEYLKPFVVKEFLTTMYPRGSVDFMEQGPIFGYQDVNQISLNHVKLINLDMDSFLYLSSSISSLTTIELVNNRIDATSLDMFIKTISFNTWPQLQSLSLSFNKMDIANLESLIFAVEEASPLLHTLKLAGCKITAPGAALLSKFLMRNRTIKTLDLAFNNIQAIGAESLSEALMLNSTLTSLNVRQNNIGRIGGESFVIAMQKNVALKVLCIADNKISGDVAVGLAARLRGTSMDLIESFKAKQLIIPKIYLNDKPTKNH